MAFDQDGSHAVNPFQLPCGQCIGCRIDRSRHWALRCVHEAQMHDQNSFVTLTYDDEHLPPDEGLRVKDWQDFAKRLRHEIGPFRFFHVGEYGEQNLRPHYHALIFGNDFSDDRYPWSQNSRREWHYRSELLESTWGLGFATVAELTYQSAAYCARYVMKKINGPAAADHYSRFDPETGELWQVKPEYLTMSRHPGIGKTWLEKYASDVYPSDEVIHQGKRFRPPRYYDNHYDPTELEKLKDKRREKVRKRNKELTPERLRTRERLQELKQQHYKRRV